MSDSINLFNLLNKEASNEEKKNNERISEQVDIEKFSNKLIKRAKKNEAENQEKTLDKVAEAAAVWEVLKDEGVL